MSVRYGTHNASDGKAVEIVVDKDEYSQNEGGDHRADAGFDMCVRPASESGRSAGFVDKSDEYSEDNEEKEYSRGTGYSGDKTVVQQSIKRSDRFPVAGEKASENDTDKERRIDLFCDKSESNSDKGRQHCNESGIIFAACLNRSGTSAIGALDRVRSAVTVTYGTIFVLTVTYLTG